jgi:methionine-gamma-lyase
MNLSSYLVKESTDKVTTKPHVLPIYATSSFVFENIDDSIEVFKGTKEAHKYSRYGNPTIDAVADKIAQMAVYGSEEKAHGLMTSSGMSAISIALTTFLNAGDAVLSQGNLYGGTTELLKKVVSRSGVETIFTNLQDLNQVEDIIKKNPHIKLCYFETPANPTMACVDIAGISALCKKHGILTIADNTFCTPYLQKPLLLGTDIVIHSTTKYLNGHGNSIAGIIICKSDLHQKELWTTLKLVGSTCNPWDAWLTNQGLKTLALRMDKHSSNSLAVAKFLEDHPRIKRVNHNGLASHPDHLIASKQMSNYGGMMSFEINGSVQDGIDFMNKLRFCTLAPTLGDVDTLILHPASSSHLNVDKEIRERNGITDGMVRVSVGIEDVEDIIGDIGEALG